jgi:hypothetical protein
VVSKNNEFKMVIFFVGANVRRVRGVGGGRVWSSSCANANENGEGRVGGGSENLSRSAKAF